MAEVSDERLREILAEEYERVGEISIAPRVRRGDSGWKAEYRALRRVASEASQLPNPKDHVQVVLNAADNPQPTEGLQVDVNGISIPDIAYRAGLQAVLRDDTGMAGRVSARDVRVIVLAALRSLPNKTERDEAGRLHAAHANTLTKSPSDQRSAAHASTLTIKPESEAAPDLIKMLAQCLAKKGQG